MSLVRLGRSFMLVTLSISFDEFWADRVRVYKLRTTNTKHFFAEFQRDPAKHAKILADRTLHREIK